MKRFGVSWIVLYTKGTMSPNPREVRKLADEILQLEERLESARKKWDDLFNGNGIIIPALELTESDASVPKKVRGRPQRDNSVSSRVLALLNSDPLTHWDAWGASRRLGVEKTAVESALYNLFVAKKIARHSRGNYEALQESAEAAA
jgi:hypothetical protein